MGRKRKESPRERLKRLCAIREALWATPTHELKEPADVKMRIMFAYLDGYERRRLDARNGRR